MARHRSSLRCVTLALAVGCAATPARKEPSGVVHVAEPESSASPDPEPAPSSTAPQTESCDRAESEADRQRAVDAYARGRSALLDNRFDESLEAFREAYRHGCNQNALFLVAIALEKLGQLDAAIAVFRQYEAVAESEIGKRRAKSYIDCIARRRQDPDADCLAEQRANPTP